MCDELSWCQPHVQSPLLLLLEKEELRFMPASCVTLKMQG